MHCALSRSDGIWMGLVDGPGWLHGRSAFAHDLMIPPFTPHCAHTHHTSLRMLCHPVRTSVLKSTSTSTCALFHSHAPICKIPHSCHSFSLILFVASAIPHPVFNLGLLSQSDSQSLSLPHLTVIRRVHSFAFPVRFSRCVRAFHSHTFVSWVA
jgi:hypothetical protein